MKSLIYFFIIISSLLIIQCSNEIPTTNNPINLELGKVSLRIDKENAPDEVVLVEAFLTREGHDTLYGNLNLISSTSADILFEDVAAGQWHLKVDAKDSSGVVLYTGETDINILAGILTQVNLTLVPTGHGTGSIYIYVNWGVNNNWIDYPNNPILSQSFLPNVPLALYRPKVLLEEGVYKMWLTGLYNSASANVWYAVSSDGINWQLGSNSPVLTPGNYNSWDSYTVMTGPVIKDDSEYRMYYLGFTDPYGIWHIGLATSPDGINWTKYPNPVVYAGSDEFEIIPSDVIKVNNTFFLYYSVKQYPYYEIRLATSQDGINFTKSNNNPVLIPDENWEGSGIYSPSVIFENNQFKMIYADVNQNNSGLGMAYSNDGVHWTKDSDNPFFSIEDVHNNWCNRITYPYWRKFNDQYRIYYTANVDGYSASKIGMIYK